MINILRYRRLTSALSVITSLIGSLALCGREAEATKVRVAAEPRPEMAGGYYDPNRAPLQPTAFMKLPIGSITPKGWLRYQLEADAKGLVGRLPEISDFLQFDKTGWVHPEKEGWEEVTYWLRGYGDLAYVLKDEKMIAEARKWLEAAMATQQADGYFGPTRLKPQANGRDLPDPWGHMPMLDALRSYYEYSHDDRVLKCLLHYFQWLNTQPVKYFGTGWGAVRWADNLNSAYWLYNLTGESWLLDLGKKMHENSANYTDKLPTMHNVNLAQGIREPAEYWVQSKDPKYLAATETDYDKIMSQYGQFPGGGFAGDENCRRGFGDPRQGFETCGIVEYMHTFEMMTRISSTPLWADRCEEIAFNSLPAALTPDHKGTHYITSANSVQLDNSKKQYRPFQNDFPMQAFKPGIHDYRCCPHNYGMGWPYYAEELWLATYDKGLCASLYAASEVKAKVGDGTEVSITEETDYPFSDTVHFKISSPKTVSFPLYLRVPRWCENAILKVNGRAVETKATPLSYVVLERAWKNGDQITWQMPMKLAVRTWEKNKNSVSVDYGPLTFSLAVGEKWQRYGGTEDWPEWAVYASTAWNYGLALDAKHPEKSLEVVHKSGPIAANPFTPETSPISLRAKAQKIPNWTMDTDNVIGVLQKSPVRTSEPIETVSLIPMGAARLRVTSFPTTSNSAEAREWQALAAKPKGSASFRFKGDRLAALENEAEPSASNDDSIPRFTWWDHKGTTEWVQLNYEKPTAFSGASVYWFDDTGKGGCRVPESWRLLYQVGNEWKPVENASNYGTGLDQSNRVTFKTVTTPALRLEVKLKPGFSGGILQWQTEKAAGSLKKQALNWSNPIFFEGRDQPGHGEVRDPCIIREGDTYYLVFTVFPFRNREESHLKEPDNGSSPGIKLYSSKDLTHWQFEQWLVKSFELPENSPYKHRFWAPEIHKIGGKFYLIFTADNWLKKEYNPAGTWGTAGYAFVGVADKINGPYEHITYVKGGACDTTLFEDTDGKTYAFIPRGNIDVQEIDLSKIYQNEVKLVGKPKKIITADNSDIGVATKPDYLEGPWAMKDHDRYYLFYAEIYKDKNYPEFQGYWTGVAYANNPFGPWKKDPRGKIFWGGHLAVFDGPDARHWYSYRSEKDGNPRGFLCVDPFDLAADGTVQGREPSVGKQSNGVEQASK